MTRTGQLKITVGNIADEVALAPAEKRGCRTPSSPERSDDKLVLRGEVERRTTEIELDVLSGHTIDLGADRRTPDRGRKARWRVR